MAQVLALGLQRRAADPDRPALIDVDDPSRTLSHHQLAGRVAEVAAALPDVSTGRRLVHVPLTAEMDPVIAYLAVRVAGHVTLVTDGHADAVAAHYRPDLVLGPRGQFLPASASAGPQHVLHPDLAVLVSTSGSTGSPKLVRLSHDNVLSNAAAIVSALGITPDDRAITLLPLHYCFGLSVLHSQLHAGGSVVLSTRSAADPDLGDLLARHRVSILPATPHVVDLLDVQGVLERDLPDLRLVTQAGGALAPDRVAAVAAQGRARGWSLVVMYGQTEATARMAVLPPELVSQHSGAVGWPIASSSFRLDTGVPEATTGVDPVGELVFSGPGVMLGYAEHPDDLALGRMVDELRTGDLARIGDDGLVRIVGRRADSVKIMGLRIDLGRVERQLAAAGVRACVTAADDSLQVTAETDGGRGGPDVRGLTAGLAGLGPSVVSVRAVDVLPRLGNGKIDRLACADLHRHAPASAGRRRQPADLAAVSAVLAPLTGHATLDPDRSFVELGGDSFSHVQASLRLGRLLGKLPVDWHHRPLRELPHLAQRAPARPRGQLVETGVLLRAAAVIMICGSHVGLFPLAGGAHVLLAIAGFSYGRYVASVSSPAERWRRTARAAVGIAVPAVVVAAVMLTVFGGAHWSNVALLHWAVRADSGNIFWFVEALLLNLVALTALLSAGRISAAYTRDPWRVAFLLTLVLLVPRYLVLALTEGPVRGLPWTVAWLFTAGVAVATARTTPRRLLTAAVAAAATAGFFPETDRNLVIVAGLCLLTLLPALVVPRLLVRPLEVVAAASLHVYLVQFQMFTFFPDPLLKFGAALVVGLLFWWASAGLLRRLQQLIPLVAAVPRPPTDRHHHHHHQREDLMCVDARS